MSRGEQCSSAGITLISLVVTLIILLILAGITLKFAFGENGIINKSGAWYAYEGNKIGQGRENAKQYLRDNPEICNEVEHKVRNHFGLEKGTEETETAPASVSTEKKKASKTEKANK